MKKMINKNQIAVTSLAVLIAVAGYLNFTQNEVPTIGQNSGSNINTGESANESNGGKAGTDKTNYAEKQSDKKSSSGKKNKSTETDNKEDLESMANVDTMDISDADSLMSEEMVDPTEVEDEETIGEAVLTQAQVGEYIAGARMEREQTHAKTRETLNTIIQNDSLDKTARQEAIDKLTALADIIEKEASTEQLLNTKGYGDSVVSIGENNVDVILNYNELSQSDRAQIEDIVTRKTGCRVDQIIISRMRI